MPKNLFQNVIFTLMMSFLMVYVMICYNLAHKLAFRIVTPQDRPIVITLAISVMIICIMCPIMSLIATILFKDAGNQLITVWAQTTFMNFPVAFFWQLMYCGPIIRFLFGKMFAKREATEPHMQEA